MLSPSGRVCRDTRGQPCVAGPAEAAPGTLVTHLQLSEKRRAEVGGKILSGKWLHCQQTPQGSPRGSLHTGGGPEGRALGEREGGPWTGIEEWQERVVPEGQSPAPSPEAGVLTWTSFLCFVTDEPTARGCNAMGRQGRML